MTLKTAFRILAATALVASLSACVVAPVGPGPVASYPAYPAYSTYPGYVSGPAVVAPAPLVVAPSFSWGVRGYWGGHRHGWR